MKPKPPPKPLEIHPYANLFPPLDDDELLALADDIKEHGQRHAIVVDADDRVLDGRSRLAACRIAQVEPIISALPITDDREALAFVMSCNIHRRHLNESQRADVAAKIANIKPGNRTGSNQHGRKPAPVPVSSDEPAVTQAEAAGMLQVSERSVRSAAKVQRKGTPELQQAVQDGSVPVKTAAKIADLPADQQPAAVAEARQPKPRKRSQLAPYDTPRQPPEFDADVASARLSQQLRDELGRWPPEHLATAAHWIRALLTELKV